MTAYNPRSDEPARSGAIRCHPVPIPGDGVALAPHRDTESGSGTGRVSRATLAAAGTLLGRGEIALSRFTERQFRIAAFTRPRHCARCYRWAPEPGALVEQPRRLPEIPAEWWCARCVELVAAERAALALDAAYRLEIESLWQRHQDLCAPCRRWGGERAVAIRFCPTGGR